MQRFVQGLGASRLTWASFVIVSGALAYDRWDLFFAWPALSWLWGVIASRIFSQSRYRHIASKWLRFWLLCFVSGVLLWVDYRAAIAINPFIAVLVGFVCGRLLWPQPRLHTSPQLDQWGRL
jgi:uncharacterized membrane protein YoaK (UPF0700 family)